MKHKITIIQRSSVFMLLLSLLFTTAWAELPSIKTGANVSGVITEKATGEPLSNVSVRE